MPWNMSVRDIRQRPSVQAMSRGGYEIAERPDPNDAMETYQRRMPQLSAGAHTSPQLPQANAMNPTIASDGVSALGQNIALTQRAKQESNVADLDYTTSDARRNLVLRDPRWLAWKQAMAEAGVDRMRTGAAAGMEGPGFFETQGPSAQQLQRQQAIDAFMTNYFGGRR